MNRNMYCAILMSIVAILSACVQVLPSHPTATPIPSWEELQEELGQYQYWPNCPSFEDFTSDNEERLRKLHTIERSQSFEEFQDMMAQLFPDHAFNIYELNAIWQERRQRSYEDYIALRWQGIEQGILPCTGMDE